MPIAVPERFEDIDADWFRDALREGGVLNLDVTGLDVELMDPSKGLIGDLALVHATHGDGMTSFVVKLPAANPDSRNIGTMLRAYEREVAFYRYVAPHCRGARLPVCYYAGENAALQRWALVLEAVAADPFDFFAGASNAQSEAAIDALADFHVAWWESPTVFDWMPGFDTSGVGGLQPLWLDSLPRFVERYGNKLPGPTRDWVLAFAPNLTAWSTRASMEPLTMVHSDCRLDNLLFTEGQVTMIDWQTAMRAPAAMDLSCFIATSLDIEVRRRDEAALVDRYLDRLAAAGVAVDRSWFARSYDETLLWWMGQFGSNLADLAPDDAIVQSALDVMVERVYTAGLDHQLDRLL